jgi:DNA-binding transcriptional regulator YhcF (GntR family)
MFVAAGAQERLVTKRRGQFQAEFIRPLVAEAAKLGIGSSELAEMIRKEEQ